MLDFEQFEQLRFDKDSPKWVQAVLADPKNTKNPYCRSLQILTNDFQHYQVGELLSYWATVDFSKLKLNPQNWMYAYCIRYGFRRDLEEKQINIYYVDKNKRTPMEAAECLSKLPEMNQQEIEQFLRHNPIKVSQKQIVNGFHRVSAMIGHVLYHGEQNYIPITTE